MTTTLTPTTPERPQATGPDRSVTLLVVAGVLVLVVVGAVLLFGIQRPPTVASLAEDPAPAPSAAVAYLTQQGSQGCVRVALPDGTTAGPWCDRMGGELVGWDEQGILLRRWDGAETVRVIDPETGEVVGRARDRAWQEPYDHQAVWTEHRDGELIVRLEADDTELWRVTAPEPYQITTSARSADGDWIALVDSADRLLVVPADGSAPPREWTRDVASWQWPVWEGTTWNR
jgi:hypothetical protein